MNGPFGDFLFARHRNAARRHVAIFSAWAKTASVCNGSKADLRLTSALDGKRTLAKLGVRPSCDRRRMSAMDCGETRLPPCSAKVTEAGESHPVDGSVWFPLTGPFLRFPATSRPARNTVFLHEPQNDWGFGAVALRDLNRGKTMLIELPKRCFVQPVFESWSARHGGRLAPPRMESNSR